MIALVWLIGVSGLVLAGVRDSNYYLLPMIALVLVGTLLFVRPARRDCGVLLLLMALWFGFVFIVADVGADRGDRWRFSFYNNIGRRILTSEEHLDYFTRHGMPVNTALIERTGKWASSDERAFYTDDRLHEFRLWANARGKNTYMTFLVTNPVYFLMAPMGDLPAMYTMTIVRHLRPDLGGTVSISQLFPVPKSIVAAYKQQINSTETSSSVTIVLREFGKQWNYAIYYGLVLGASLCLATYLAFRLWRSKAELVMRPWIAVPAGLILLSFPHSWLVWHGDPMEVSRHSFLAAFQFYLGTLLLMVFSYDYLSIAAPPIAKRLAARICNSWRSAH